MMIPCDCFCDGLNTTNTSGWDDFFHPFLQVCGRFLIGLWQLWLSQMG